MDRVEDPEALITININGAEIKAGGSDAKIVAPK
jgi:hypothetical protein